MLTFTNICVSLVILAIADAANAGCWPRADCKPHQYGRAHPSVYEKSFAPVENRHPGEGKSHSHMYKNKSRWRRDVVDEMPDALDKFDAKILQELSPEMSKMSHQEKVLFIQDFKELNEAVKYQATIMGYSANVTDEILPQVFATIAKQYENQSWFQRLRSSFGDKVIKIVKQIYMGL